MGLFGRLFGRKINEPEEAATIGLQGKTSTVRGHIEKYWFENENIGLKKTLFHRINIPLTPFNSGIDYEEQPVSTCILIEWLSLDLDDPNSLDGVSISSKLNSDVETTIYLGSAHNSCEILNMNLKKIDAGIYEVSAQLFVDFESEGVACNENFNFTTELEYNPSIELE